MRFLIHIACGPENPSRCALGLLVAKTAVEEGHTVDVFLAGDGAGLARLDAAANVQGIGTGNVGDHLRALLDQQVSVYVSGLSAHARGIDAEALKASGFIPGPPAKLVALAAEADRVITY